MFDVAGLPDLDALPEADDAALLAAIGGWSQVEAAAARRLAAIAELVGRRLDDDRERSRWACDGWDAVAAQVGAAMDVSHSKASGQMYLAAALRERLPKVGALLADGVLNAALVAGIAWRTTLIQDRQALAAVDTALAGAAVSYGPLSAGKTAAAIDAIIEAHDPAALRRTRQRARSRDVVIDKHHTEDATTPLWGRLYAHDAETLGRRLMAMAHGVCADDRRTIAQRRADALGALAAGAEQLACACANPHCPVRGGEKHPAGAAVIHVLAHPDSIDTPADAHRNGAEPPHRLAPRTSLPQPSPPPSPTRRSRPRRRCCWAARSSRRRCWRS